MGFEKKIDFFEVLNYVTSKGYKIRYIKSQLYTLRIHDMLDNEMFYCRYSNIEKCFYKLKDLDNISLIGLSDVSKFNLNEFFNFCRVRFNDNLKLSISKEQREYNKSVIDYIDKRIEYLI